MTNITLRQCYFCKEWLLPEQVKELNLERYPASSPDNVYACEGCLKTQRLDRLTAKASKALASGAFNEIEVTEGELKVHLVRYTPVPYYAYPLQYSVSPP